MSILIKGMEMPKNCWECSLSDVDDDYGRCCLFSGIACLNIGRQNNCPLIEIPTPHGRLIEEPKELHYGGLLNISPYDFVGTTEYFMNQIKEQPTIIEAEGSKE